MAVCFECEEEGPDLVTRCYHNFHSNCLFWYVENIMDERCPVCDGPVDIRDEENFENMIREFYEGKLDLNELSLDQLQAICKSVFTGKRKDFSEILLEIFKIQDLKQFCVYEAALCGHLESFEWLINQVDSWDKTKLLKNAYNLYAFDFKDLKVLKRLLEIELDLMGKDDKNDNHEFIEAVANCFKLKNDDAMNYIFLLACRVSYVSIIETLIQKGVELEALDEHGKGALHYAAMNNSHPEVIDFLVSKGVQLSEEKHLVLNEIEYDKENAELIAEKFIKIGAHVRRFKKNPNRYFIGDIIYKGNMKCLKLLLQHGLDINERLDYNNNTTLLLRSIDYQQIDFIKEIIALGADVNAVDDKGANALHLACSHISLEKLELFLSLGLDVNSVDKEGQSPIIYLLNRLNLSSYTRWGIMPERLINVSRRRALKVLKVLVESGADVNLSECHGLRPIHLCAEYYHVEMAKLLVKCGADINAKDNKGRSLAHFLCENPGSDHLEFIKNAFDLGLDVAALDNDGRTPLDHCRSDYLRPELVKLIENLNQKNQSLSILVARRYP